MRALTMAITAASLLLASCGDQAAAPGAGPRSPGRYAGIGTFDAGRLWAEMADAKEPSDAAAATVADDEHVIVVVDSHTGEIRQCGDHSGVCVTMNPWSTGSSPVGAPVKLKQHAADLIAADSVGTEGAPAVEESAPSR